MSLEVRLEVNCNADIFVTQKWNINKGTMRGKDISLETN